MWNFAWPSRPRCPSVLQNLTWIGATSRPCGAKNQIFGLWVNLIQAVCRFASDAITTSVQYYCNVEALLNFRPLKAALFLMTDGTEHQIPKLLEQEAQLTLTNPSDAYRGQSRSPNIVTFHVRYSLLLVSLRHDVFPIFDFKNVVTLKSGSEVTQGHWKRYHSIDCACFPICVL